MVPRISSDRHGKSEVLTTRLTLLSFMLAIAGCGPSVYSAAYWQPNPSGNWANDGYRCTLDQVTYNAYGDLFWLRCTEQKGWVRAKR